MRHRNVSLIALPMTLPLFIGTWYSLLPDPQENCLSPTPLKLE